MPTDLLSEEVIKEAVKLAVIRDYEREVLNLLEEDKHVFSVEFERKMEELLMDYTSDLKRRRKKMPIKYLLVAILIFLMSGMTVLAIPGVRDRIAKYCEMLFSDHTDVKFELPAEKTEREKRSLRFINQRIFRKGTNFMRRNIQENLKVIGVVT